MTEVLIDKYVFKGHTVSIYWAPREQAYLVKYSYQGRCHAEHTKKVESLTDARVAAKTLMYLRVYSF